jgi:hypothetical protein
MDSITEYLNHYIEYAPGVLAMAAVLWRIDRYASQIVKSCIKCWDRDQEDAHDVRESMVNPE